MIIDFTRRWLEIEPLLDRLFDVPALERTEWLRRHCTDTTLRTLVAQALDDAPGVEALERGVAQWLPTLAESPVDAPPTIAGYRVLRFVDAGGMASVFEAERELPGGPQKVALKLLRIDVHSPEERRRFLREQRLLARLQHANIAQLLDAGFSPTGTPFLALEFVDGDNLVAHCERHHLSVRARLALLIDVCAAVEHAHRSLIVHCDLKPSNVLVGADGCVKLVDFGIATLLTGEAEHTRSAARWLTRAYAAPEQLAGDHATTAFDVFALGVLLAELLCGLRPRKPEHGAAAHAQALDDAALRQRLGVDLHAIVRDATRFDPWRRYASVGALRDDIERYLDGRPLHARADTFAYRAFTLVRRHALAVLGGVAIAAILGAATVVSLHESRIARRAAGEAHDQARVAQNEVQRTEAIKTFLEGLFDSASPGVHSGETAEELLVRGRARADRDFALQPALHAEILALIGDLERRSGHADHALQPLEAAATLATQQFGVQDRRTLHVEYLLAKELDQLGRVREAKARLQQAVEAFASGPNRDSPENVVALAWLAGLDERSGESAPAISLGENALALARRVLPSASDALTEAVTNLGWILIDAGHADRAEPLLREALARTRHRFGPRHADVADAMTMLTAALIRLGRYSEGERLMRDALDIDAHVYTHPHAHLAWHLNDLANVLVLEGKLTEARSLYLQSIAVDRALAPAAALNEATTLGNLARTRFKQGDTAAAAAGFRDAIARKQVLLGTDYGDNGRGYDQASLAAILIACGKLDEASALADAALADARGRYRDAHPDTAFALTVEARLAQARGDPRAALAHARDAVAMYAALADPLSQKAIRSQLLYGEILLDFDRAGDAKAQFQSALATASKAAPNSPALVAHAAADLASVRTRLGDRDGARRLRVEVDAMLAEVRSEPSTERDEATRLIAGVAPSKRR